MSTYDFALTQRAEVVSCSGRWSGPAAGRAGAAGRHCWHGERSQCSGHPGFAPLPSTLLRLPEALHGAGPALRAAPVFGSSTKVQIRLGLRFVRLAFLKTSLDVYTLKRTLNSLVCTLDACLKCRASLVWPRPTCFVQLETSDENTETCGLSAPLVAARGTGPAPAFGRPAGLAGALSLTLASCSS